MSILYEVDNFQVEDPLLDDDGQNDIGTWQSRDYIQNVPQWSVLFFDADSDHYV